MNLVHFKSLSNANLARLCGPMDSHIRQIELGLEVKIARRNTSFTLSGQAIAIAAAEQVLSQLAIVVEKRVLNLDEIQLILVDAKAQGVLSESFNSESFNGESFQGETTFHAPAVDAFNADNNQNSHTPELKTRKPGLGGRTPSQRSYIQNILSHDITMGIGPAGTGKTYLAVACAVDALERDLVKRIVLTRPAVEAGERLGFLPGDLSQKIDPYLRPLYDALYDLMGYEKTQKLFEKQSIEIAPLAYMRGRTLNHSFIILDEAQNTTTEQMKMLLTRIGFGSKAVITGDISQIDLPKHVGSGLLQASQVLQGVRGVASNTFTSLDVVRHPLVARVVEAYETYEKRL